MTTPEGEPRFEVPFEQLLLIELTPEQPEFIGEIDNSIDPSNYGTVMAIRAGQTEYTVAQHPDEENQLYVHRQTKTDETGEYYILQKGTSLRIGRFADIANPYDRTMSREHCDVEYDEAGFVHVRSLSQVNHTLVYLHNIHRLVITEILDNLQTVELPQIAAPEEAEPLLHCRGAGYSMVPENYRPERPGSEDRMLVNNDLKLYGVFDGIGSRRQSALSAEFIARSIEQTLQEKTENDELLLPTQRLTQALVIANRDIVDKLALSDEFKLSDDERLTLRSILSVKPEVRFLNRKAIENIVFSELGSTACLAQVTERFDGTPVVAWASVGDSRLYLVRDKKLHQLSEDESLDGRSITNWVGMHANEFKVRNYGEEACFSGDRFVLVTDGVTGDYKEQRITDEDFIRAALCQNVDDAAWKLTRIAKKRDDRTAVVIDIA